MYALVRALFDHDRLNGVVRGGYARRAAHLFASRVGEGDEIRLKSLFGVCWTKKASQPGPRDGRSDTHNWHINLWRG